MNEDRARHHGRHSELGGPTGGGGDDLFIALPDDVVILILVCLRCSRTSVRTGALSHRWHGLWTRLPDLVFRDMAPGSLLAALSSLGAGCVPVSLLDIDVPAAVQDKVRANHVGTRTGLRSSLRLRRRPASYVSSLLRAAGQFSPAAFRFNHPHQLEKPFLDVDLSTCFQGTTSIELHAQLLCFPDPQSELPALQRLSLSGCRISLASLVPLCPRLHMLRVADTFLQPDGFAIRSASLQELIVENNVVNSTIQCIHIIVEAPLLKRFTMSLRTRGDLSISVLAPLVDKVSWRCLYTGSTAGLGLWGLSAVRLETEESKGVQEEGDAPRVHVLCLHMFARPYPRGYPNDQLGFATEIEKHMITDFSSLEVHLRTTEHVFGAFMLRLLGMHPIRTATQSLKIILQRFEMKDRCTPLVNCSCDEPKDWRTQTISLTNLEKVEIKQFNGQDHEFDFLKLIFRCAPMLTRLALELTEGFTSDDGWCTEIHNIFMVYPSVECTVDYIVQGRSTAGQVVCQHDSSH